MPTVAQLDEAYADVDEYPASGNKDEKLAFAESYDGGDAVGGFDEPAEEGEPAPKKSKKGGESYLLFDSIHYQDDDGHWQAHGVADGPVSLSAAEVERLTELGAVTDSEKDAAEHWEALAVAQAGVPVGSTSPV